MQSAIKASRKTEPDIRRLLCDSFLNRNPLLLPVGKTLAGRPRINT